ncbi:PQQ-dependent sugar dehydrogenase [Streptomyces sp. N2-109]|uniref:PQQ-dependent sugar dehydrogenase n=1 Tax=Streptomyces gossypii TaxID=2883101 RepID=A0ABT2JSZ1_9ACTN|nr:PQQ-dependent sugar dehydrogenase [Streptomyces gossypii]MCT2590978.1 PQQ-dependent sugar dehydrogenase [Streptomyces gossypii]
MKVRKSSVIIGALGLAASLALSTASSAQQRDAPLPADTQLRKVASAEAPTAGTAGPRGKVWIAEKSGRVRVLNDRGLSKPVLDISDETRNEGERGLLGIAFDPGFDHFYISFTDLEGTSTVDEFAVRRGQIQPDTRRTVITQEQPYPNHNGGHIAFGPDGMLYIGLGDGGSGGDPQDNGQNRETLLGNMLRIDPSRGDPYAIPEDNPFVDDPEVRDEIWAYGLRNPWRFSFDAAKGDLLIGDVGQNTREEIDWAPADSPGGENYGWARMEGTLSFSGEEPENHVPPVFEYDRAGERCAVTGGYVYRGRAIPGLRGDYLYSDFCDGEIRALEMKDGKVLGSTDLGVNGGSVASFVEGCDRELYVLDLDGTVYRLEPA